MQRIRYRWLILCVLALVATSCSRERRFPLEGQVLAVDAVKGELTVRHSDIKGFMPGMTMPFKVTDKAVLNERKPGDLIRATLVVENSLGRLEDVVRTGEAPLPADALVPSSAEVLIPGALAPDATLLDQDARTRRLSEWKGKAIGVTFVYTRCPLSDFCPLMDKHFAAVQRAVLGDPALAERVHLLSVSFDPDFDTPDVLRAHAKRVGSDPRIWTWLTGTRDAVDPFAKAFGISIMRGDQPKAEIVHNLRTVVLDPSGRVTRVFNGNDWKPEELLEALRAADVR
jgi:protein SCO1/2